MKKIVIHRPGGYDRLKLEEHPDREPGPGEVRIAVSHAGVNYADCVVRMGLYASAKQLVGWPPPRSSFHNRGAGMTPGFEVAGTVDRTGAGVTDLRPGDAVIGVTLFGGYASQLVVPRTQVFALPAGLSPAQAAGIPAVFLTAWFALHELAHVRAGEKVLVHSSAGGVGSAAVQLAARAGAEVTAVVGAAHKRGLPASLGARHVIDKSSQALWDEAERIAPGGFDVVLDANGVSTLGDSYRHLAPLGRLVVYGFHSMLPRRGGKPDWLKLAWDWLRTPRFSPLRLTTENRSVLAFNLSFLSQRTDRLLPAMHAILAGFADGTLRCLPVCTFPLDRVADAHSVLESGTTVGKLVLEI